MKVIGQPLPWYRVSIYEPSGEYNRSAVSWHIHSLQKLDASFWFNAWCRRHMRGLNSECLPLLQATGPGRWPGSGNGFQGKRLEGAFADHIYDRVLVTERTVLNGQGSGYLG
jgi:hypothetical protein